MAKVSGIYIGGKEKHAQERFRSGVSFSLDAVSLINRVFVFNNGKWEVEIRQGSNVIVARCKNTGRADETVTKGYSFCQEALDLLAVSIEGLYSILNASYNYQVLFQEQGKSILRHYGQIKWAIGVESEIIVYQDGKPVPVEPEPQPEWHESFRFYRTSQSSSDLFEAYRNMYLAFESLLNKICPRNRDEGEIVWLKRALSSLRSIVSLDEYAPPGKDPVDYFITHQYKSIRCKLFHAKGQVILPHEALNPVVVQKAYESLLMLWRRMAVVHMQTRSSGGAIMTNSGFRNMLDIAFENGLSIYVTKDSTPISRDDNVISPSGLPCTELEQADYTWNQTTNRAVLRANLQGGKLVKEPLIARICSFTGEGVMMTVSMIEGGTETTGIDVFEVKLEVRPFNKNIPKTIF